MKHATIVLSRTFRRILQIQLLIILLTALVAASLSNNTSTISVLYGGLISICNLYLSANGVHKTALAGQLVKKAGLQQMAVYVVIKFFVILVLFALGIGWMDLSAPIMIGTFALMQLSYLFNHVNTTYLPKS